MPQLDPMVPNWSDSGRISGGPDDVDVSVIIATLNRPRQLIETLQMALAQRGVRREVVVIDQTAIYPPDVAEKIEALKSKIVYIKSNVKNASHARNIGVQAARGGIVVFVDDDVEFDSLLISKHFALHQRYPSAGAVLGLIIEKPWKNRDQEIKDRIKWLAPKGSADEFGCIPITWAPSGNISYKRTVLLEAGGFDESMTSYCEDIDLSLRVRACGHPVMFSMEPVLIHIGATKGGCEQRNEALQQQKFSERHVALHYMLFKNWKVLGISTVFRHLWGGIRSEFLNLLVLRSGLTVLCRKSLSHIRLVIRAFGGALRGAMPPSPPGLDQHPEERPRLN